MININDCIDQLDMYGLDTADSAVNDYYIEQANSYDLGVYSDKKAKALRVLAVCYLALSSGVRELSSRSAKVGSQSFKQKDSLKMLADLIADLDCNGLIDDLTGGINDRAFIAVGGY